MDTSLISAMSGVLGSLVGGSAMLATAWVTQKSLSRRELVREEMRKREALYSEFIGECAKRLVDAFAHHLDSAETMLQMYALINRIRLVSTPAVLTEAEHLLRRITEQYFCEPLTTEQLRRLASSEDADPLKAFGEACRAEFRSMYGSL